jgi:FRG domain
MDTLEITTWKEFEGGAVQIESAVNVQIGYAVKDMDLNTQYKPRVLYRGHGNATWTLQTTLERRLGGRHMSLMEYYRKAYEAKHEIGAHTGHTWEIVTPEEYREWLKDYHNKKGVELFKAYGYLAYLRQFGFPSPLLDWTASPYVAAFFAFDDPPKDATHVAIYAYVDRLRATKTWTLSEPHIQTMGPFVDSHKRHFLQQCQYTLAMAKKNGAWMYQSHEEVQAAAIKGQDVVFKFKIPVTERVSALRTLDRYNINAFSLFGSDDALMQTMANRLFEFAP